MSYYNHTLASLISCVNPRVVDMCFVNFWKWKMFPSFIHVAISAYYGYLLCFVLFFFSTLTSTPHQARQPLTASYTDPVSVRSSPGTFLKMPPKSEWHPTSVSEEQGAVNPSFQRRAERPIHVCRLPLSPPFAGDLSGHGMCSACLASWEL